MDEKKSASTSILWDPRGVQSNGVLLFQLHVSCLLVHFYCSFWELENCSGHNFQEGKSIASANAN